MENSKNIFEWWGEALEASIPFWHNWGRVSQSQKEILDNYRSPFWDEYEKFLRLAPSSLNQTINPWSFSLIQFTNQIKGDPPIEYKILTQVAGYGSQLGTILDFLGVLARVCRLDEKNLKDREEIDAVERFYELVDRVNQVKQEFKALVPAAAS
jgi:hypothetical protein